MIRSWATLDMVLEPAAVMKMTITKEVPFAIICDDLHLFDVLFVLQFDWNEILNSQISCLILFCLVHVKPFTKDYQSQNCKKVAIHAKDFLPYLIAATATGPII